MRIPFLTSRRDYALEPLSVADAAAISALHREDFVRPWTDGEFATLLSQDTVFGFTAREVGQGAKPPVGFVLARLAAGEAEILTVAVPPWARRRGIAKALMAAALSTARELGAATAFLEVDVDNAPAVALYEGLGFERAGLRKAYYDRGGAGRADALVMRLDLGPQAH